MRCLLLLVLIIIVGTLSAQSLPMEKISVKDILYKDTAIPYERSENIFKEVPASYNEYLNSLKALRTGKSLGYATLGVLGVSIVAIAVDNHDGGYCDLFCLTTGDVIGIIGIGLVFPVLGSASLITHFTGISGQNRAIGVFNDHFSNQSLQSQYPSLQFGLTNNGIGFVLNF